MTYEQSAPYYDAIYTAIKDYRAEAERVHQLIQELSAWPAKSLLDVACGTGLHDQYLCEWYDVDGIDLSSAQLAIAKQRLGDRVHLMQGDMRTFYVEHGVESQQWLGPNRQYDAITCLFSAIGHLGGIDELGQTIGNFDRHLRPGGVVLIEPWLQPHMWREGIISMNVVDEPELKLVRINRSSRTGNLIELDFEFLVGEPGGNKHFRETHEVMMFTEDEFQAAFAAAGFQSRFDPAGINDNGRGIYIAYKPLP